MAEDVVCTKDGTVNYLGKPANKRKTGNWRACPFILGYECCERLTYYGISTNLVRYFKYQLHQHSAIASKNVADWVGTCYITPLIGAFVADAYLGRYLTILYLSVVYVIGLTLLALSATVPGIKPTCFAKDNCHATHAQSAVCIVALYLIALGAGGIKPCMSSFGADQFDDADELEKQNKSSFFNWFYFSICVGALIGASLLVWIQDNVSWGLGFGIPAVAIAIAVVSFISGTRLYRNQKPGGSPFTRICQVTVASIRKYDVEIPNDKSLLYETEDKESAIQGSRKLDHSNGLRFFDKAAVVGNSDNVKDSVNPWRHCTVTQVEELKAVIRLLPVWATGIMFSTIFGQMTNYFVLQGETMDNHVGNLKFQIPPASLFFFNNLIVIFGIPVYDRVIVPIARKFSGHRNGLTQLQRTGIGLFISIFSMLYASTLEYMRLRMVRKHNYYQLKEVPISIFWQVPPYVIIGIAEIFISIGQLEFFYEQAPDAMRSLCSALSLLTEALGQYLSSLLVTIVSKVTTRNGSPGWLPHNLNYGHLDYFFWLLTGLSVINFIAFLYVAKSYTYKKSSGTLR